ncbi:MAG: hypothetical protein GEV08_18390 [Acidimicrobiia bacterium]|nr:hypothetical protein [Acidimicrobiia bacterium]
MSPTPTAHPHPADRTAACWRLLAMISLAAILAAACASGNESGTASSGDPTALAAEVASYDLVAGRPGRFILGVFAADRERSLAYGTIDLRFRALDTSGGGEDGQFSAPVAAEFLPVPGQDPPTDATTAELVPRLRGHRRLRRPRRALRPCGVLGGRSERHRRRGRRDRDCRLHRAGNLPDPCAR